MRFKDFKQRIQRKIRNKKSIDENDILFKNFPETYILEFNME